MADHSPEPWHAQPAYNGPEWASEGEWFVHAGPWLVATVHAHRRGSDTAHNAYLIQASPALLRTCRLQQEQIHQLMPHIPRTKLDDFELLATAPRQASLAIQMASARGNSSHPHRPDPASSLSGNPPAESNSARLEDAFRKMLKALKALLPVIERFERQASAGSGGRREGELFAQVRNIIREAEQITS